jgi:YD repeat-containing protein
MSQVLAVADFEVEFKDYTKGQVITIADEAVVSHLKSRKVVSANAADVAAAIAGGAVQLVHSKGAPAADLSQSGGVADSTYTIDQRDTSGRWSLMTYGGTQYAATYNAFGTYSTITGGGKTLTYSYDAAGRLTGMTAA